MRRRILLSGDSGGEVDYSKSYLTFTALESGTFSLVVPASITSSHITDGVSYSIDNGATWTTVAITSSAQTITTPTIPAGGKVLWKAVANRFGTSISVYCNFQATGNFDVSGNIMSLEYGDDFVGQTSLKNYSYSMTHLFNENTKVISAENLILPATIIRSYCYCGMFYKCSSLITAPSILPATTLASDCYSSMFVNCSNLTTAPELPATTLASNCYFQMFYGCISLTVAPNLPATTLAGACYRGMFSYCTSLTTAPELPVKKLVTYCYYTMFSDCTSLTTAPELPATTLATYCYVSMFEGCTSLTTAPELPATTLAYNCYEEMFDSCSSLTASPILPATTLANNCYSGMFRNCSKLNLVTCLATDISAASCTKNWVLGVAATGTFSKPVSMTSWTTGVSGIPSGWTTESYGKREYLTFVSEANNNTISFKASDASLLKTISVSVDNGATWTQYTSSTSGTVLATLNSGRKLLVKGSETAYANSSYYNCFVSTGNFYVEGNIMSLLYGDNFVGQTSLSGKSYAFRSLFSSCNKITSAENLSLPATTLAGHCYSNMFYGCTSLTTAPELPATTLAYNCYGGMFQDCSNLNYIKAMFTTTPGTFYTNSWVSGVSSTGTFVKNSTATWTTTGVNAVPSGWTVETASS